MGFLTAVGITIGILAGLWTWASLSFGLLTWAAFLSWGSFFAVGGKVDGLKKGLLANVSGVVWGWLILQAATFLAGYVGQPIAFGIAVALGAAAMCWQARFALLGFIPGAFLGTAGFVGAGFDLKAILIALVAGGVLAYLSELSANALVAATSAKKPEQAAA